MKLILALSGCAIAVTAFACGGDDATQTPADNGGSSAAGTTGTGGSTTTGTGGSTTGTGGAKGGAAGMTGATGGSSAGGKGGSTGTGGSKTGTGGAGGAMSCATCSAVTSPGGPDPSALCTMNGPPASDAIFNDLIMCDCSKCSTECATSVCMGKGPTAACNTCVMAKCASAVMACNNDK